MVRLLMIFGQIWDEPWYGKNPRLVQGFATGPDDVEMTGGAFVPVPGAIATEIQRVSLVGVFQEPQCARGGHHQAKRVGPDKTRDLAALVLAESVERMAVSNGNFDRPAGVILLQDVLRAQGQV